MRYEEPNTVEDFREYYDLRWRVLREPEGLPRGSEKDDKEDDCFHLLVRSSNGELYGVGKIKSCEDYDAVQISHVAVEEKLRGQGIGKKIMAYLEGHAKEQGVSKIVLTAREPSMSFYKQIGYSMVHEITSVLPTMRVFKMEKML